MLDIFKNLMPGRLRSTVLWRIGKQFVAFAKSCFPKDQ